VLPWKKVYVLDDRKLEGRKKGDRGHGKKEGPLVLSCSAEKKAASPIFINLVVEGEVEKGEKEGGRGQKSKKKKEYNIFPLPL